MHASLALARRMDLAEIRFCARAARAGETGGASSLNAGGGTALCGSPGSPFNKVLGLGLGADVTDDELDAIDVFYDERGVPAQIELCPLSAPGLPARLGARGYVVQAFENQLVATLAESPPAVVKADAVVVTPVETAADDDAWLVVASHGFAAGEGAQAAAPDVVEAIAEVMRTFRHESMTRYLARVDGEPVGAGAAYFADGIVGMTGTATLPAHRRRGVQHAVVAGMMRRAKGQADLAMATTEPGSRSQRTFERHGFQVAYTRAIFVRPLRG